MQAVELARALDGQRIQHDRNEWPFDSATGTVDVQPLPDSDTSDVWLVRVSFSTTAYDHSDYIFNSEIESGFTSKVKLLSLEGNEVGRVSHIQMRKPDDETPATYSVDFEIVKGALSTPARIVFMKGDEVIASVDPIA